MSKATQIKILFVLFAYSAVLFHSTIPHCHTNDAHAARYGVASEHHTCDGHHHDDAQSEPHEHQVCHIESLHGDYLKSELDYTLDADFSSSEIIQLIAFTLFGKEVTGVFHHSKSVTIVRSCWLASTILRGPPVLLLG